MAASPRPRQEVEPRTPLPQLCGDTDSEATDEGLHSPASAVLSAALSRRSTVAVPSCDEELLRENAALRSEVERLQSAGYRAEQARQFEDCLTQRQAVARKDVLESLTREVTQLKMYAAHPANIARTEALVSTFIEASTDVTEARRVRELSERVVHLEGERARLDALLKQAKRDAAQRVATERELFLRRTEVLRERSDALDEVRAAQAKAKHTGLRVRHHLGDLRKGVRAIRSAVQAAATLTFSAEAFEDLRDSVDALDAAAENSAAEAVHERHRSMVRSACDSGAVIPPSADPDEPRARQRRLKAKTLGTQTEVRTADAWEQCDVRPMSSHAATTAELLPVPLDARPKPGDPPGALLQAPAKRLSLSGSLLRRRSRVGSVSSEAPPRRASVSPEAAVPKRRRSSAKATVNAFATGARSRSDVQSEKQQERRARESEQAAREALRREESLRLKMLAKRPSLVAIPRPDAGDLRVGSPFRAGASPGDVSVDTDTETSSQGLPVSRTVGRGSVKKDGAGSGQARAPLVRATTVSMPPLEPLPSHTSTGDTATGKRKPKGKQGRPGHESSTGSNSAAKKAEIASKLSAGGSPERAPPDAVKTPAGKAAARPRLLSHERWSSATRTNATGVAELSPMARFPAAAAAPTDRSPMPQSRSPKRPGTAQAHSTTAPSPQHARPATALATTSATPTVPEVQRPQSGPASHRHTPTYRKPVRVGQRPQTPPRARSAAEVRRDEQEADLFRCDSLERRAMVVWLRRFHRSRLAVMQRFAAGRMANVRGVRPHSAADVQRPSTAAGRTVEECHRPTERHLERPSTAPAPTQSPSVRCATQVREDRNAAAVLGEAAVLQRIVEQGESARAAGPTPAMLRLTTAPSGPAAKMRSAVGRTTFGL